MSTLREEIEVDISFWYANHELCPTCLVNLRALPPAANIVPHYYGLCLDRTYKEMEWENERESRAILSYQRQMREQKPGMFISGLKLLKAFVAAAGILLLPWVVIYAVAAWFRLL